MPYLPPLLSDSERREIERSRRAQDWHSVTIYGAKAAITFVFLVPILALAAEFICRGVLHESPLIVDSLGQLLWLCAGGMVTLLTIAFKMGAAREDTDDRLLLDSHGNTSLSQPDKHD